MKIFPIHLHNIYNHEQNIRENLWFPCEIAIKSILVHEYQHNPTQINTSLTRVNTNHHEFKTSQHESDTSKRKSNTSSA